MIQCPECSQTLPDWAETCQFCGNAIPDELRTKPSFEEKADADYIDSASRGGYLKPEVIRVLFFVTTLYIGCAGIYDFVVALIEGGTFGLLGGLLGLIVGVVGLGAAFGVRAFRPVLRVLAFILLVLAVLSLGLLAFAGLFAFSWWMMLIVILISLLDIATLLFVIWIVGEMEDGRVNWN